MTTFPYLKVARDYGVPYSEVLRVSDIFDRTQPFDAAIFGTDGNDDWCRATHEAWIKEQERRKP